MPSFDFLVGTFNAPYIYTFRLTVSSASAQPTLHLLHRSDAVGAHSWLHLSDDKRFLYTTGWTEPPSLAAYAVQGSEGVKLINSVQSASRSGYVCASDKVVYSAGGAVVEAFAIDPATGGFAVSVINGDRTPKGSPIQQMQLVEPKAQKDNGSVMDFGGVRHGAHSVDFSPDGRSLYVADIGRNCVWTFSVDPKDGKLALGEQSKAPRSNDGPRHTWPHPSGKYLYSLQEHSSMVDVFEVDKSGVKLTHVQAVRILPDGFHEDDFWADEVRTSLSNGAQPTYLYASNRGLKKEKKGYVAAFRLTAEGRIDDGGVAGQEQNALLDMWTTPTSGGWANAIQPGPTVDGVEYLALTDSEEGAVSILSFDGQRFKEAVRYAFDDGAGAATAVWL